MFHKRDKSVHMSTMYWVIVSIGYRYFSLFAALQELEQPLDPPDVTTDELPTTSVAPLSTARPERPFRRAPARAKPKATG